MGDIELTDFRQRTDSVLSRVSFGPVTTYNDDDDDDDDDDNDYGDRDRDDSGVDNEGADLNDLEIKVGVTSDGRMGDGGRTGNGRRSANPDPRGDQPGVATTVLTVKTITDLRRQSNPFADEGRRGSTPFVNAGSVVIVPNKVPEEPVRRRLSSNVVVTKKKIKNAKASSETTAMNIFKSFVGAGILSMPFAFAKAGWSAIGVLLFLGAIVVFSCFSLVEAADRLSQISGENICSNRQTFLKCPIMSPYMISKGKPVQF